MCSRGSDATVTTLLTYQWIARARAYPHECTPDAPNLTSDLVISAAPSLRSLRAGDAVPGLEDTGHVTALD